MTIENKNFDFSYCNVAQQLNMSFIRTLNRDCHVHTVVKKQLTFVVKVVSECQSEIGALRILQSLISLHLVKILSFSSTIVCQNNLLFMGTSTLPLVAVSF